MSTDRMTPNSETVPDFWTEFDELFFTLVGDVLSTSFLWGATALLASYDVETDDGAPAAGEHTRPSRSGAGLPRQRGLDGWTVDPQGGTRYGAA